MLWMAAIGGDEMCVFYTVEVSSLTAGVPVVCLFFNSHVD